MCRCSYLGEHGKELQECREAPFYTLGPLVTDIAPAMITLLRRLARRKLVGMAPPCCVM